MRAAQVLFRDTIAGVVTEYSDGTYGFRYNETYVAHPNAPAVSLTLPKREAPYVSQTLFPFLHQLLPEGTNKRLLCELQRVDPADEFSILLLVARADTVGAVTIRPITDD